ncbi:MAG: alanine--glyoxylate aminotransferase family protein [Planctomycetota bacterium]|nr:alanine--glyoxylate aminotransferase family protein [Planctomycetota bacterium]
MESEINRFIPGPVAVDKTVLDAMGRQPLYHRSSEMHSILEEVNENLRWLFRTSGKVFIATASASAVMEASLRNLVTTHALCVVNGSFGQLWQKMARSNGIRATALHFENGRAAEPERIAEELKRNYYDVVTVVHTESSTGVQNPLEAIAAVVKLHSNTLLVVDAVSSLLTTPLDVDGLGIDVCITASQKGLALPPGLAIFSVSEQALRRASKVENRGYYLDFLRFRDYEKLSETPNTPAVNLIYALAVRLKSLRKSGIGAEIRKCEEMAEICREWAKQRFALFPDERYAASALTVVKNTKSVSIPELNQFLRQRGFEIADGYRELKGQTFRISHMGAVSKESLSSLLDSIDSFLKEKNSYAS